jgi:hypothetical protein
MLLQSQWHRKTFFFCIQLVYNAPSLCYARVCKILHCKKNGGASYPCWIFVNNNLSVSLSGAIIITPSSSEVNTETRQYT